MRKNRPTSATETKKIQFFMLSCERGKFVYFTFPGNKVNWFEPSLFQGRKRKHKLIRRHAYTARYHPEKLNIYKSLQQMACILSLQHNHLIPIQRETFLKQQYLNFHEDCNPRGQIFLWKGTDLNLVNFSHSRICIDVKLKKTNDLRSRRKRESWWQFITIYTFSENETVVLPCKHSTFWGFALRGKREREIDSCTI